MKKKLLNLFAIIIGVLMCFCFNQVHAEDSIFGGANITRENFRGLGAGNIGEPINVPVNKKLGISETRKSGNRYRWGIQTDETGHVIWKIATYSSDTSAADYKDLYYCLNVDRGFGITVSGGEMLEEEKDDYKDSYDMTLEANKTKIT